MENSRRLILPPEGGSVNLREFLADYNLLSRKVINSTIACLKKFEDFFHSKVPLKKRGGGHTERPI